MAYLREREDFFKPPSAEVSPQGNVKQTKTDLIRQWAIDRNLHTADPTKQALKLGEEFGELFEGLAKGNADLTKDAIGDMYVVMTILAQQLGFTIEECIDIAYDEIKDRRGKMIDGVFVKESDLTDGSQLASNFEKGGRLNDAITTHRRTR